MLLHPQSTQSERERRLPGCLLYGRPWLLIGQLRVRGSNQPSDSGAQAGPDQLLISCAEDREKREKQEGRRTTQVQPAWHVTEGL